MVGSVDELMGLRRSLQLELQKTTPWLGTARQVLRERFECRLGQQRKELVYLQLLLWGRNAFTLPSSDG